MKFIFVWVLALTAVLFRGAEGHETTSSVQSFTCAPDNEDSATTAAAAHSHLLASVRDEKTYSEAFNAVNACITSGSLFGRFVSGSGPLLVSFASPKLKRIAAVGEEAFEITDQTEQLSDDHGGCIRHFSTDLSVTAPGTAPESAEVEEFEVGLNAPAAVLNRLHKLHMDRTDRLRYSGVLIGATLWLSPEWKPSIVAAPEAPTSADRALQANSPAFTLGNKLRRLSILSGLTGDDGHQNHQRQLNKIDGAVSTGRRTILMIRAKFSNQQDSSAISAATLEQFGSRLTSTVREKSYGAVDLSSITYGGSAGSSCLYTLDIASNDAGLYSGTGPIRTVWSSIQRVNDALPANSNCKITGTFHTATGYNPNSLSWSHVIVWVPSSAVINFAGVAWRPGSQVVMSSDANSVTSTDPNMAYYGQYEFNALYHELGHNWGLGHANVIDVFSGQDVEYGDGTDTMGSISQLPYVTKPLSMDLGAGYKHGLGFLPDSRVADFSYASLTAGTANLYLSPNGGGGTNAWASPKVSGSLPYAYPYSSDGLNVYSTNLVLAALERQGLRQTHFAPANVASRALHAVRMQQAVPTSSIGGLVLSNDALTSGYFDLSFRIPDPQRIPNRWLYASYRARSSTAKNAVSLAEVTQGWGSGAGAELYSDTDYFLPSTKLFLGESILYDSVPSSPDLGDSDLDPSNLKAVVYEFERDSSSSARKWLISTKGANAASASPLQLPDNPALIANGVTLSSDDLAAVPLRVQPLNPTTYERVAGRGCTFRHGCQPDPTTSSLTCNAASSTTISLSPMQPGRAFKISGFPSSTSSMVTIRARVVDSPAGVAIGVYQSAFPAAQILYGADVAVRAVAYSNFSISKDSATQGYYISTSEVELTFTMSPNHDYSIAILGSGLNAIEDSSLLDLDPFYVSVSVACADQVVCDPTNSGASSGIYLSSAAVSSDYVGYYQVDPAAPVVATASGGYLTYTRNTVGPTQMKTMVTFDPVDRRWELQYYREYNGLGNVATKTWSSDSAVAAKIPTSIPSSLTGGGITCACPKNSYIDGGAVCKPCGNGMVSMPGSSSADACTCDRGWGYGSAPGGAFQCTLCPANTFKSTISNTGCKPCATGYVSLPGSQTAAACRLPAYDTLKLTSSTISGFSQGKTFYRSDIFMSQLNGNVFYNSSSNPSAVAPPHPANGLSVAELELEDGVPTFYSNTSCIENPLTYFILKFDFNSDTPAQSRWRLLCNFFDSSRGYYDYGYNTTLGPPHMITSLRTTSSLDVVTVTPSCSVGTYDSASGQCRITPTFAAVTATTSTAVNNVDVDSLAFAVSQLSLNPVSRCPEGYKRTNAGLARGCTTCGTAYHTATSASGGTTCACPSGYTVSGGNCIPPAQLYIYFNDQSSGFGLRGTFNLSAEINPSSASDLGYGFRWPEYKATVNRTFGSYGGDSTGDSGDGQPVTLYFTYLPWRREWALSSTSMATTRDTSILSPSNPRFGYITNSTISVPLGVNTLFMFSPYSLDFEPVSITIVAVDLANTTASLMGVPSIGPSATPQPGASSTPALPTLSPRPSIDKSKTSMYKEMRANVTIGTANITNTFSLTHAKNGAVLLSLRDLITLRTNVPFDNVQIEGLLLVNRSSGSRRRALSSASSSSDVEDGLSSVVVMRVSLDDVPESGYVSWSDISVAAPAAALPRRLGVTTATVSANSAIYQLLVRVTPSESITNVYSALQSMSSSDFSSVISTLATVSGKSASYYSASYDSSAVTVSQMQVTSDSSSTTNNGSSFTLSTVAWIVIGCVGGVLVIFCCGLCWWCCCRTKKTVPPVIYTEEQLRAMELQAAATMTYPQYPSYQQAGKGSPTYAVETGISADLQSPQGRPGFFTPTSATASVTANMPSTAGGMGGLGSPMAAMPVGTSVVVAVDENGVARQQAFILASQQQVASPGASAPPSYASGYDYYRGQNSDITGSNRKAGALPQSQSRAASAPRPHAESKSDDDDDDDDDEDPSAAPAVVAVRSVRSSTAAAGAGGDAAATGLNAYDYAEEGNNRSRRGSGVPTSRVVADL